ncbi:LIM domain only protein 7b isoform X3 [Pimephales promelas]|uniref:LIM domain only protein 7b isoform X3 n=1 Tax=Pimephales promelas TaxID=90988 RepID=UPI0019558A1F|nr:LIM domain only protein 7b isoform X3 [Pimephales promelas]
MEWRQQSAVSCELAFEEAQRWLEEVTNKRFGSKTFRVALEDGVLLCDLINKLKPGIIKRLNRLSTPIAGLDNVNVFLKACEKLGLNEAQLFHPGDLQDVSTRVTVRREETCRRLKNVLITIYWLGRKAQSDPFYTGPQLNLKAFEGLLGIALSKALVESVQSKSSVRDSGYVEGWFSDREDLLSLKQSGYRREDSVESLDSVEFRPLRVASDGTIRAGSEGCFSDAEAEHCFRMAEGSKNDAPIRGRVHVPSALRKKRQEHQQGDRSYAGHLIRFPIRRSRYPGSKSMGDIPLDPIPQESDNCSSFDRLGSRHVHQRSVGELTLEPSAIQRVQHEQLQNIRARMKESEAKWHEDLNKWKSRRRSTNSDLHRKREEREQIELMSAGGTSAIRTAQLTGGREESSNMPGPMSDAGSSVRSASLTGWSTTSASPLTNGTSSSLTRGTDIETPDSAQTCTGEFFNSPAAVVSEPYEQRGPDFSRRDSFLESFYAGGARISATLPRGFRRSEGCSRLSTGITPRLFGAKPSKVSTLPKVYSIDDSHKSLISGRRDYSVIPSFLSGQGKITSSGETGHSHSSTLEDWRDGRSSAPPMSSFVTKVNTTASMMQTSPPVDSKVREIKVGQSEMRVCLNQKPNSGRDFGFKAHWDSTGACVKSVQSGSPAELCGLLMGDEIVALGGCKVAEMNYEQFKGSMDSAQQKGTLLMDIRRHGQNDWGSGHPSLPYKSHKTINLTSANSTLIGRPENYVSISTTSNSPVETVVKTQVNGRPANVSQDRNIMNEVDFEKSKALTKMVNGRIQDNPVTLRNKDYERIALKNHTRKLEFFMNKGATVSSWVYLCGGSESAISDLQVPSISSTSSRWSWDHEEERRRQEKWQMEQERLLQEKYRRDQEKLEEEWRRAQEEFYGEEHSGPEEQKCFAVLSNGNTTAQIPPPIATTSVASNQIAEKVGAEKNRQTALQIAPGHQSLKTEVECDSTTKSQCSEESYGFAKLTVSDRTKSKSTPALESLHKQDAKAAGSGKKKGQLSQAEKERLQILEEMRKKTQLLTDGSWIRQRNAINKESITAGTSIKSYESLENLHTTGSWSRQSYTSGLTNRPHSALGSTGSYRSGRSSLGPGSAIFSTGLKQALSASNVHSPPITTTHETSVPESRSNSQQCGRVLSGRRMCSRCEQPLGKGAAMVIDSLELCFHIGCFKCVSCRTDLGRGIESGAQVRVRHRQLFCNNCYRVCPSSSK